MAKLVIVGAVNTIATVNYDPQILSSVLSITVPEVPTTNMNSAGWKEILGGVKEFTIAYEFIQDSDLSGLGAAMFAALGTVIAFTSAHITGGPTGPIPEYQGFFLVNAWNHNATLGEALGQSVTFPGSGTLVRAVA